MWANGKKSSLDPATFSPPHTWWMTVWSSCDYWILAGDGTVFQLQMYQMWIFWIWQRLCWLCRPKWELFKSGFLGWVGMDPRSLEPTAVIGSRLRMSQELSVGEERRGWQVCGMEHKDRCSTSARRGNMTPFPKRGDRERFLCSASKTDSPSTSFSSLMCGSCCFL